MKKNKFIQNYLMVLLMFIAAFVLFGCGGNEDSGVKTLRVYNWQDYIDEGFDENQKKVYNSVMEDWILDYEKRTGEKVELVYNTFETNEYMLNVLKTGSEHYDLVCPSDYIIQKMIAEDMIEKFDYSDETGYKNIANYNNYGSPFIKDIFNKYKTTNKVTSEQLSWSNYAIPYMWGTMGFVYDTSKVTTEDASTWNILWNDKYANQSTAKDSFHDTYVAGVMYVYQDELNQLKATYEASNKTLEDRTTYNDAITEIMNRVDDATITKVQEALLKMKDNFYGFEVDNGKTDILGGTITINFAWSGDAVYAMDKADDANNGVTLAYALPEEGSNIFFDGWVMPKGANKELAEDFLNYMCDPKIAARNMNTIGYTSSIAGDEIWDLANEWYADEDGEEVDLTYFFKGTLSDDRLTDSKAIIKVSERGRQFDAQYPTEEAILRCAVMEDFGDQNNAVLTMWENVKGGKTSIWLWIGLGFVALVVLGFVVYKINSKNVRKKRRK